MQIVYYNLTHDACKRKSNLLLTKTKFIFMTNSELRAYAREALAGNWTNAVLCTLVYLVICSVGSIPTIGQVLLLLIMLPLGYSMATTFLQFTRKENKLEIENLFAIFKKYGAILGVTLLTTLYTALWTMLLVVPGIIKSYSYAMTYYIHHDNQALSAEEAICQSMKMMEGKKLDLFLLDISFIGWYLLAILSLGIGFFWLIPYHQTARVAFYQQLCENNEN